jgi:hypothetical protein
MWTVRSIYEWLKSGRSEWQLFHWDSVFEAVIVAHPTGAILRYHYRGELYDEQIYPSRADARRHAADMHRKFAAIGWSEDCARAAAAPAPSRMSTSSRLPADACEMRR